MEGTAVFDLLAATRPFTEYADKLTLYGQFVGSWDIDATWYEREGGQRKGTGEWHFAWILGGRGIQDVLFASRACVLIGLARRCAATTPLRMSGTSSGCSPTEASSSILLADKWGTGSCRKS
jgi:hypothetical protein